MSDEFQLPQGAATNIRGRFVPDDPDYYKYARGQLRGILKSMEQNKEIGEGELLRKVLAEGWKFSPQSFHAQVRNLRKPDNGGFCIRTRVKNKVNFFTLIGRHGNVAHCTACDFAPYRRLDAEDAVRLYRASQDGDYKSIEDFMRTFLRDRGLAALIDEVPQPEEDVLDLLGDDW
jgi:hypothetical protein